MYNSFIGTAGSISLRLAMYAMESFLPLNWLTQRRIDFRWHDVTKLTEVTIAEMYIIRFVFKYHLGDFDVF